MQYCFHQFFGRILIAFLLLGSITGSYPIEAHAHHVQFHFDRINALIQQYGKPTIIDTIVAARHGFITIEYRQLIIEDVTDRPSIELINCHTIARDLTRMKMGVSGFSRLLAAAPSSHSSDTVVSTRHLEKYYKRQLANNASLAESIDARVSSRLRQLPDRSEQLLFAAGKAHVDSVVRLIEEGADVNYQARSGLTPLMQAAQFRQYSTTRQDPLRVANILIDAGADLSSVDCQKYSAISLAIVNGRADMVELLHAHGASIDHEALQVHKLLHNEKEEMLTWLANAGISLEARQIGATPLIRALHDYAPPTAERLLELGANPCVSDDNGQTALMHALHYKEASLFTTILNQCPSSTVHQRTREQATALHYTAFLTLPDQTATLLAAGADVDAKTRNGRTPLHKVAEYRQSRTVDRVIETAAILLKAGAQIDAVDSLGNTTMILAAEQGMPEFFAFLLGKGADLFFVNNSGSSAVHILARRGHTEAVNAILHHGKAIGTPDLLAKDTTPLIVEAVTRNLPQTALALIAGGADPGRKTRNDTTALMSAAEHEQGYAVVNALLSKGADLDAQNNMGQTALMLAISRARHNSTLLLLNRGADPHLLDDNGQSAVHIAARYGNPSALKLLIERGVPINSQDHSGITPLMETVSLETARILLAAGADPALQDRRGRTALDHAQQMHRQEIAALLASPP